jgi:hypothetical protein
MQIHHASQSGGESKSVLDAAVSVQPHQSVPLCDVVQKTDFPISNQRRISQSSFFSFLSFSQSKAEEIKTRECV